MGWSKDLGPTEWAGSLSAVFYGEKSMHELSIFVDESGDFGEYAKHSPYYAVCTLALLQKRYDANKLTRSDMLLFHSRNDLRKDFLKRIRDFPGLTRIFTYFKIIP